MSSNKRVAYLPTPFKTRDLWVVALQDTQSNALLERLVLADPQASGLMSIQQHVQGQGIELLMAMSLDHLKNLHQQLTQQEATQGALPGTPFTAPPSTPAWATDGNQPFVVTWCTPTGLLHTTWFHTSTAGEALVALHHHQPEAVILGVANLQALSQQLEDLGGCVTRQDFGQLGWDLRQHVEHPATVAHIEGHRQSTRGGFATPELGMLAVHQLYLDDLAQEEDVLHG